MINDSEIQLSGELTFSTVSQKSKKLKQQIAQVPAQILEINMAAVSKTDSSGLALMLEGLKYSQLLGKQISYQKVPPLLLRLAKFCSLEEILPIS